MTVKEILNEVDKNVLRMFFSLHRYENMIDFNE